jgi:hypothetical protein
MRASTFHNAQNSLCRIPAGLRVSSGGARLAHQAAMHSGVSAFVQAIMERYTGWQTHWPSLDLVLRQNPSGMTMAPIYHQVQMQVVPRLNLTIQGETLIRHQQSIERVERTLRAQLVQSLSTRGTRIEAVATQGGLTANGFNNTPSPGMGAALPLARPISKAVRRPVAEPAPDNRRLAADISMTLPGRRPIVAGRTDPPAPAAIDMNRLTDQVIQAIDRRIIAQRERLGRT